jgi:FKBP-type peptidyl-prolyl cis-trans isomerase FkpA
MNKNWITLSILLFVGISLTSCFEDPPPANNEVTKIDEFLAASGTTDQILYDNSSGLRFVFHTFGTEPPPHKGQTITAYYSGRLFSDGTVFESGLLNTKLDDIAVPGLQYGIASLMKGSDVTIYIPSKHGYGTAGTTNVPPNSTLVYNVELVDVEKSAVEIERFKIDTAAIHTHLKNNMITAAVQHPSGVWYVIENAGTAPNPYPYDIVTFDYTLKLLSDGTIKEAGTIQDQSVFGLIDGMKVGLPLIGKDGKATFYIPSGLGYGSTASGSLPANSNLIFEVTLKSVLR